MDYRYVFVQHNDIRSCNFYLQDLYKHNLPVHLNYGTSWLFFIFFRRQGLYISIYESPIQAHFPFPTLEK